MKTQRPFKKPPTTYAEQIALLRERGMHIGDESAAIFYLKHLNYYRLGAYWLPFEANHTPHRFKPNTAFEDVLNLYIFDRELRLLVLDAIERMEVSVRCQWAYHLAHHYGPHAHLNRNIARKQELWEKNIEDLHKEVDRSDEVFIRHLRAEYQEELPPVWAVCEVMSLGLLSKWYDNLQPGRTRRAIASTYQLDDQILSSWLRHLALVRNVCAHHARLWNREFVVIPQAPLTKPKTMIKEFMPSSRKVYNALIILLHFMDIIAPGHHWRAQAKALLKSNNIPLSHMGFPDDWQERFIWNDNLMKLQIAAN